MMKYNENNNRPSLLTNTELEWLLGLKQVSKSFEYKIKSTLKKKINSLALNYLYLSKIKYWINS
jgi:hypothetical protein